ncbi:MAG: pyridoxal phosphate-dependent decarboxylase family protein [Candidatus Eiseniibacteriota bacterium]
MEDPSRIATQTDRPLEPDSETLRAWLRAAENLVIEHLATLAQQPSWDTEGALAVAQGLVEPIPRTGRPIDAVLARLLPAITKSFNTIGPGYLAYIPGGGIPSAGVADLIACETNRFVNVSMAAPALARMETLVLEWLCELMGLPKGSGGIWTSGGSLSNLAAIVAARVELLGEELEGGRLYFADETHASVPKAARVAGFPERALRRIPVDDRLRMIPAALEQSIIEDRGQGLRPFLIIANAGTTNTGAIDPIAEVVAIARRHGVWAHADAAYGGFFRIVPEAAARFAGIEEYDSITLDPHKGLFLPYGTGCLLVRDPESLRRAHGGHEASYLQDVSGSAGVPNMTDFSAELSRDFRGLRLWLPLQLHGIDAFVQQLSEKLALTRYAYERLREEPLIEILDEPQLSIVAFSVRPPAGHRLDADAFGAELLARVNARRRVFLSSTRIRGRYVLRICIVSFRTHEDRVRDAVDALIEEARALARG